MKSEKIRKKSMQTDRFPPGFYFTKADNNASSFIWEIYELRDPYIFDILLLIAGSHHMTSFL